MKSTRKSPLITRLTFSLVTVVALFWLLSMGIFAFSNYADTKATILRFLRDAGHARASEEIRFMRATELRAVELLQHWTVPSAAADSPAQLTAWQGARVAQTEPREAGVHTALDAGSLARLAPPRLSRRYLDAFVYRSGAGMLLYSMDHGSAAAARARRHDVNDLIERATRAPLAHAQAGRVDKAQDVASSRSSRDSLPGERGSSTESGPYGTQGMHAQLCWGTPRYDALSETWRVSVAAAARAPDGVLTLAGYTITLDRGHERTLLPGAIPALLTRQGELVSTPQSAVAPQLAGILRQLDLQGGAPFPARVGEYFLVHHRLCGPDLEWATFFPAADIERQALRAALAQVPATLAALALLIVAVVRIVRHTLGRRLRTFEAAVAVPAPALCAPARERDDELGRAASGYRTQIETLTQRCVRLERESGQLETALRACAAQLKQAHAQVEEHAASTCRPETGDASAPAQALLAAPPPRPLHDAHCRMYARTRYALPWSLKILIVDDVDANREIIVEMARSLGQRPYAMASGAAALDAASHHVFDLVLLDLRMPVMDGIETARRWRSGTGGNLDPDTMLVALTADATPSARDATRRAGLDGILNKPLRLPDLAAAMQRAAQNQLERGVDMCVAENASRPIFDLCDAATLQRVIRELAGLTHTAARAYGAGDLNQLLADLHAIKGCAGQAGLTGVWEYAKALETLASQTRFPVAVALAELRGMIYEHLGDRPAPISSDRCAATPASSPRRCGHQACASD